MYHSFIIMSFHNSFSRVKNKGNVIFKFNEPYIFVYIHCKSL